MNREKNQEETLAPEGYHYVRCRCIHRNGKVVYPKNKKCFCFLVKDRK
ncbi:MAG: hypothetical protein PHX08_24005 [Lachnospiraceae bacterium]|nr:hypothetical protein [Lachnospiraceae bacterium]